MIKLRNREVIAYASEELAKVRIGETFTFYSENGSPVYMRVGSLGSCKCVDLRSGLIVDSLNGDSIVYLVDVDAEFSRRTAKRV